MDIKNAIDDLRKELLKGRDVSRLKKQIVTDKNGHQKTVYVSTGDEILTQRTTARPQHDPGYPSNNEQQENSKKIISDFSSTRKSGDGKSEEIAGSLNVRALHPRKVSVQNFKKALKKDGFFVRVSDGGMISWSKKK
jgi:hypothetical protein